MIRIVFAQRSAFWSVDAGLKEDLSCKAFIHSYRAAQRVRASVSDAKKVKSSLKLSVFAFAPVKAQECNISQTAEFDDVWPKETV